jgi:hypothetical protein
MRWDTRYRLRVEYEIGRPRDFVDHVIEQNPEQSVRYPPWYFAWL